MSEPLRVAVGVLADFACRSGDLESGGVAGVTARQGQQAHQRIQARELARDAELASEVSVAHACTIAATPMVLTGRIDLCNPKGKALVEIKTTRVPAERVPASRQAVHWAQALLYGFCISDGEAVTVELLYADVLAQRETRLVRTVPASELATFAHRALQAYLCWQQRISRLLARTVNTAVSVEFPFGGYRRGQRELAVAAYRSIRDGEHLLCEAPTGIGKSISTLYPAIKAIGTGCVSQVICLTAKTSGVDAFIQALRHLEARGLAITALVLRARQRSCFCARGLVERGADGICPMTTGFHDRLPDARIELIEKGIIDGDRLDDVAWQHQVCPFELGLRLLPWVDVAVGDYAYVFDPIASLAYFADTSRSMTLLIDEAHNLPERARSMYTAQLDSRTCELALHACGRHDPTLMRAIGRLQRALRTAVRGLKEAGETREQAPSAVARAASNLAEALGEAAGRDERLAEPVLELWQATLRYCVISEQYGVHHRTVLGAQGQVRLVCLNAAAALTKDYRQFRATLLFSGTLRPFHFYAQVLGLSDSVRKLALDSPFATTQALHLSVPWIDTRLPARQRTEASLVELLATVLAFKRGNYVVFFPSYHYLQQVLLAFNSCYPDVETWQQEPGTDVREREALLARLKRPGHRLGFAIMGGVLGEGIDYAGDSLIGIVIVGVGLPAVTLEQNLLVDQFQRAGLDGYDHVYRYPGLVRLMQAAGRLIRRDDDRGVVVLVDQRLQQPFYRRLLPAYWCVRQVTCKAGLTDRLQDFWQSKTIVSESD